MEIQKGSVAAFKFHIELSPQSPLPLPHHASTSPATSPPLCPITKNWHSNTPKPAISMTPDKKRLRVGVLFGGRSGEHEVSLASAASVIRGLDPDKYEAVPIGITKEGHWLIGTGAQKMLPEVLRGGRRVMLTADPTEAALVPLDRGSG